MKSWIAKLWPRGQTKRGAAVSGIMLLTIVIAFAVFVPTWTWSGVGSIKDLAGIFQSAITVFAIVIGGVFAWFKLQAFRDFEPHLTISHEVRHRIISESYLHIDVTATLYNSSRVKMDFHEAFALLQKIAPTSDEEVERLHAKAFVDLKREGSQYLVLEDFQWPALYEVPRIWDVNELMIEPGESHRETYEFIVSTEVESVIVYTFYYNSQDNSKAPEGWGATTVYDIVKGSNLAE